MFQFPPHLQPSLTGLTMSVQKTQLMVTGYNVTEDEKMAIDTDLGRVEHVQHF